MKIACFGDSLTYGKVGYSYIKYLDKSVTVVNKGINGDTTVCAYERLKKYIESPKHDDTDTYIVAIGINDLLIPFLTTVSPLWKAQMSPRVAIKRCVTNDSEFKAAYEKYIELILSHYKRIILIGMPFLQLENFPNQDVTKRNNVIKNLAEKHHIPFIDTVFIQSQLNGNIQSTYSWKNKSIIRVSDALFMLLFPFSKDWFSKLRHLGLTVDGVHYNSISASVIAAEIEKVYVKNKDNE